jgi:CD109 antigen
MKPMCKGSHEIAFSLYFYFVQFIQVPRTSIEGDYRLRVEGNDNGLVGGTAFVNETELHFSKRSMTIFIQTDKPVYMQGQTG